MGEFRVKKKAYITTIIFLLSIELMLALTSGKAIKVARCIVPEIGGCLIDEQPVILINKLETSRITGNRSYPINYIYF